MATSLHHHHALQWFDSKESQNLNIFVEIHGGWNFQPSKLALFEFFRIFKGYLDLEHCRCRKGRGISYRLKSTELGLQCFNMISTIECWWSDNWLTHSTRLRAFGKLVYYWDILNLREAWDLSSLEIEFYFLVTKLVTPLRLQHDVNTQELGHFQWQTMKEFGCQG